MQALGLEQASNASPITPSASLYYSDEYTINLSADDLSRIERTFYTTHTSKWAENCWAIIDAFEPLSASIASIDRILEKGCCICLIKPSLCHHGSWLFTLN